MDAVTGLIATVLTLSTWSVVALVGAFTMLAWFNNVYRIPIRITVFHFHSHTYKYGDNGGADESDDDDDNGPGGNKIGSNLFDYDGGSDDSSDDDGDEPPWWLNPRKHFERRARARRFNQAGLQGLLAIANEPHPPILYID